jgi:DNA-directed RNA polymerase specialized sigma24 family protein
MRSDGDFEAFYQASYHRLVGQLTTLTGSLEDAEDAVQEAFARASTRWARLRDYDAPEAWVRRVAFNLATSGLRRARRQLTALARLGAAAAEPGRSTDRWRSRLACGGCRSTTGRSWCCTTARTCRLSRWRNNSGCRSGP